MMPPSAGPRRLCSSRGSNDDVQILVGNLLNRFRPVGSVQRERFFDLEGGRDDSLHAGPVVPVGFIDVAELGLDEFPRSDNGKVLRSELQRHLEQKFGVAVKAAVPTIDSQRTFIADKTKSLVCEIMQIDTVSDNQQMDNTPSWDSINHLQLVLALEQSFGVTFHAAQIGDMTSVDAVIREVTKLKPQ